MGPKGCLVRKIVWSWCSACCRSAFCWRNAQRQTLSRLREGFPLSMRLTDWNTWQLVTFLYRRQHWHLCYSKEAKSKAKNISCISQTIECVKCTVGSLGERLSQCNLSYSVHIFSWSIPLLLNLYRYSVWKRGHIGPVRTVWQSEGCPPWACQNVPEQDTKPQIAPDELLGTLHGSQSPLVCECVWMVNEKHQPFSALNKGAI